MEVIAFPDGPANPLLPNRALDRAMPVRTSPPFPLSFMYREQPRVGTGDRHCYNEDSTRQEITRKM